MEPIKLEYKTYEQLKEELGSEYDTAMYEINMSALHEIERLNNILKEVRDTIEDYIDNYNSFGDYEIHWECKRELLEILDKANDMEDK